MTRTWRIDLGLTSNNRWRSLACRVTFSTKLYINQMGRETDKHALCVYCACYVFVHGRPLSFAVHGKRAEAPRWGGRRWSWSLINMYDLLCEGAHTWLSVNLFWSTCVCHSMTSKVKETERLSHECNREIFIYELFKVLLPDTVVEFYFLFVESLHCLFLEHFCPNSIQT